MGLFGKGSVDVVESPSQEETDQEIEERIRNEREAKGAFFKTLKDGGADELRKPTTGINF